LGEPAAGSAPATTSAPASAGVPAPAPAAPAAAPAPRAGPVAVESGERSPLRGAALRIAENMEKSLSVPTATSQRQIPIKLLDENRRLINDFRSVNGQSKVSFTHLVAWAVLRALKAFPRLNDAFDASGSAPARLRRDRVGFGLAVDVEKSDGTRTLLVPSVKGAEEMSFAQFAAAADDLIARARQGKLQVFDFEGTTISLTNPGTLGTTASVPRLMPGQGLIVATGAIEYPAEFSAMAPEVLSRLAISKVVTFTSTYDHRIIQGAESGLFLARIEELLLGKHEFYDGVFADLGVPFRPLHWATDKSPGLFSDSRTAEIEKQARVLELINAYRVRGHLIADIDPLRLMPVQNHPELDLETYGLTIWDLDRPFWTGGLSGREHMPLREIVALMRRVYCGKVGIEYRFISNPAEKEWIRRRVGAPPEPLPTPVRQRLLAKLVAAETFERFLGTRFLGQRRYSIEGTETAIAFLDQLVEGASARGVDEVSMGLTHRGRLNILANVVGNSTERIFSGFQGTVHPDFPADEGDVKYHQGARSCRKTESGREIEISVPSNPSHLEAVDPVVEGLVRAKQDRTGLPREESWLKIFPVLLHGDAAFAGQGIVAEVFNLAQLRGYRTGGTLHLVVNNQIGFTTDPASGRSSLYSTDVAKINQVPIFHVNGDDPEAAYRVLQIALDYRQEFHKDIVVDLIGFRLHGHNEGDEPTYTQPLMYRRIQEHPGVRTLYARRLVREGVLTEAQVQELEAAQLASYEAALTAAKEAGERSGPPEPAPRAVEPGRIEVVPTGVARDALRSIGRTMTTVPSGFHLNPKMVQQLARRAKMADGSLPLDWATAEGLAFSSILLERTMIRMSGQDTARGTFSQRHLVFHDTQTDGDWIPLCHLGPEQAAFQIFDSPLSEMGVLGFEYGYSVERPDALVIWEAQYGDFANGAQVIIDQFISSAEDKWRESSRLTLLLPHGYEGQGPEHSSARIERYLQLCAEDNLQVCNLTTPAQYFHLLRRQVRQERAKPLVLFTPKSLLRLPASFSPLDELTAGGFRALLEDPEPGDRRGVRRVLISSGKVHYDLKAAREERHDAQTALLRVEQLYPFPAEELREALAAFPAAKDVVWVQEEPRNMGGWTFAAPRLEEVLPEGARLRY
ncbi:MAG TPA: multifunctional oxoglutarate decarboxylase/oxoglutarate dehydrogenase thiamine pyrophosphate-binding subunit/dihydrolipoyllysine-residue succinyltransferase subunit, partial [Thermoanaerobaculia bacterium]|nr:multifunctional oxoglutarate decarboxylase/oxoglutarate dehydrogenase thiamine pyrophosphate-binding subunit/dihydrolipoyllysine-residue succinyltransferase subunit [Thermoanaerobaculia bacterium]